MGSWLQIRKGRSWEDKKILHDKDNVWVGECWVNEGRIYN